MFEKKIWIILINTQQLRLFKTENGKIPYEEIKFDLPHIKNDTEVLSDKPGRSFSSAGTSPSSHVMTKSISPKRKVKNQAAKLAAEFLYKQFLKEKFAGIHIAGIYLIATSELLGLLRPEFKKEMSILIVQELPKDLINASWETIREHLPYTL